jgi:hypothetical protein
MLSSSEEESMRIRNAEAMTHDEMRQELERGGRLVVFHWVVSVCVVTFKRPSDIHFFPVGADAASASMPYTLLTLLLGWWGLPFGPIYSVVSLISNLRGGKDVTLEVLERIPSLYAAPVPTRTRDDGSGQPVSPDAQWYTRKNASATPKGPFSTMAIAEALRDGHLSPHSEVRRADSNEWLILRDHAMFRGPPYK